MNLPSDALLDNRCSTVVINDTVFKFQINVTNIHLLQYHTINIYKHIVTLGINILVMYVIGIINIF